MDDDDVGATARDRRRLVVWWRAGLQLKKDQDVHIVTDTRGRATGEAFVRFGNLDDTEKVLKRNREKIGSRWVCCSLSISTLSLSVSEAILLMPFLILSLGTTHATTG